jgi:hypothetical protein
VSQANPDSIVVTPQAGSPMTFKINDRTQVQIDGRQASAGEIRQGGDARVAYQMSGAEPTATVIQVITGQVQRRSTSPGTGTSSPSAPEPAPSAPSEPSSPQRP